MPRSRSVSFAVSYARNDPEPNALGLDVGEPSPVLERHVAGGTTVTVEAVRPDDIPRSSLPSFVNQEVERGRQPRPFGPQPAGLSIKPSVKESLRPPAPARPMRRFGVVLHAHDARQLRQNDRTLLQWMQHNRPPPTVTQKLLRVHASINSMDVLFCAPEALHDEMFVVTLTLDNIVNLARNALLQRDWGRPGIGSNRRNVSERMEAVALGDNAHDDIVELERRAQLQQIWSQQGYGSSRLADQLGDLTDAYNADAEALNHSATVLVEASHCSRALAQTLVRALMVVGATAQASDPREQDVPAIWAGLYKATRASIVNYQRAERELKHWRWHIDTHLQQMGLCRPRPHGPEGFQPQVLLPPRPLLEPLRLSTPAEQNSVAIHLRRHLESGENLEQIVARAADSIKEGVQDITLCWSSAIAPSNRPPLFDLAPWPNWFGPPEAPLTPQS